jgi:hypothetical protein
MITRWTIGNILTPSESTLRKLRVQMSRVLTNEMCKDFSFLLARQIRAGGGRGYKKLRKISAFDRQITLLCEAL